MAKVDIMNLLISYCPPFWHIGHHDPAEKTPVLVKLFQQKPFVTMTGPRQSGKTTLCRMAFPHLKYVNLEAPDQREFAESDPRGFLARLGTGVILDEIQRVPEFPSYLQVLADEEGRCCRGFPAKWSSMGAQTVSPGETPTWRRWRICRRCSGVSTVERGTDSQAVDRQNSNWIIGASKKAVQQPRAARPSDLAPTV